MPRVDAPKADAFFFKVVSVKWICGKWGDLISLRGVGSFFRFFYIYSSNILHVAFLCHSR